MSRILITGGSGFIGTHTVNHALSEGYDVRVLDLVPPQSSDVEYIQGDIRDQEKCDYASAKVDYVVHLAAMARSGPSTGVWEDCVSTNVVGTANMIQSAIKFDVKRLVYAGSSTFYGNQLGPQSTDYAPNYLNFYGATKGFGEELVRQAHVHLSLGAVILRYFNVYGAGQPSDGNYGLVMGIFSEASQQNQRVIIDGDGSQSRDFIHVNDVSKANLAAINYGVPGSTYNVGTGVKTSISDLAKLFNLKFDFGPSRIGDAAETWADISASENELNWRPTISLRDGVEMLHGRL
jgi:UDP-glucose 4-epimerase